MSAFPSYSAAPMMAGAIPFPMGTQPSFTMQVPMQQTMMMPQMMPQGMPGYGYGYQPYGGYGMMMVPQAPAQPGEPGYVHPEFPHLGPIQAYPETCTPQDEMMLQKLYSMYGQQEARDGLPGFPYIGAPFIGDYKTKEEEEVEMPYEPQDDEEVRGTQV